MGLEDSQISISRPTLSVGSGRSSVQGTELRRKCYVIPRAFVVLDNNIRSCGHLLVTNLSFAEFLSFTHQVLPKFTIPSENPDQATPVPCYSSTHLYNSFQICMSSKAFMFFKYNYMPFFPFLTFGIHFCALCICS